MATLFVKMQPGANYSVYKKESGKLVEVTDENTRRAALQAYHGRGFSLTDLFQLPGSPRKVEI